MNGGGSFLMDQAIAIAALLLSFVSLIFSWRQHLLSHAQDRRRKPLLIGEYLEGFFKTDEVSRARTCHFKLAVRNPSDSDNALARLELAVHYQLEDGTKIVARVAASEAAVEGRLAIPQRVGAHETIAGWSQFDLGAAVASGRQIDSYRIEITDSHSQLAAVAPILLSERADAR
ncbi:hypothetical protein [Sphingopyxis fribergensis]